MKKSKLITLLKTLSKSDFSKFEKYLNSKIFNSNPSLVFFFNQIKKFYPNFDSTKLNEINIYNNIFTNEYFDERRMYKLRNGLLNRLERFLIHIELEENDFIKSKLLIQAISKRNAPSHLSNKLKKAIAQSEKTTPKNAHHFMELYFLQNQWQNQLGSLKYNSNENSGKEAMKNIDLFYAFSKLQLASELLNREKFLNEKNEIQLLEQIEDFVLNLPKTEFNPILNLYIHIIHLWKEKPTASKFQYVKKFFKFHFNNVPVNLRLEILTLLINYTLFMYNKGNSDYIDEQFDLYQFGEEKGLLLKNNIITDSTYTNIIVIGSALKKFEWTLNFMEKYQEHLDLQIKDHAIMLANAYYQFNKGAFKKVLKIKNSDNLSVSYELRVKGLLHRNYYELYLKDENFYDELMKDFKRFNIFIKKHRDISTFKKTAYLNLSKFIKTFVEKRNLVKNKHAAKKILKVKLAETKPIMAKAWLNEKLKSL